MRLWPGAKKDSAKSTSRWSQPVFTAQVKWTSSPESSAHVNRVIESYIVGNVQTSILIGVAFHNRDTVPAEVDIDAVLDHGVYIISGDHRREALSRLHKKLS